MGRHRLRTLGACFFLLPLISPSSGPGAGLSDGSTEPGISLRAPRGTSNWVKDENLKPGTDAWRIPADAPTSIEGYADRVSVQDGGHIGLYVSTVAPSFHVEAYRMGYYQGLGARLVWTSAEVPGSVQDPPIRDPVTNMVEAPWARSLRVSITPEWVQGVYLLKLVSSSGAQSYVPLTVRDDSSQAALVIQNAVTTWQAYNKWGGYSLYMGPDGKFRTRARVVSFDRPYAEARGAVGLLNGTELPVIAMVERLGLDITYWTDVDLHERPWLLRRHRALITLQHDEYWSSAMRRAALKGRKLYGVNIAFLGGNADYRHIRFEDSPLGPDRRVVCYKVATEDPLYGIDDREVTVNWREPPIPRPESRLNGAMFECSKSDADMVVVDASSWLWEGTGVTDGEHLNRVVVEEYDRVTARAPTPENIEVLAHSPLDCGRLHSHSDMTYYTTSSGAGVFDAGSFGGTAALKCGPPTKTWRCSPEIVRLTENLLAAFAAGPAGLAHPSLSNLADLGIVLKHPIRV